MAIRRLFAPAAALCGVGAVLVVVPPLSVSLPAYFPALLTAFWHFTWYLDARFTASNWRMVLDGREANVLLLTLARAAPCRPMTVLAAHAVFSIAAAAGLQALVTHSFDFSVTSCILAVFGILHVDAVCRSRQFVRKAKLSKFDAAGKDGR